jgi:hypothetical protein
MATPGARVSGFQRPSLNESIGTIVRQEPANRDQRLWPKRDARDQAFERLRIPDLRDLIVEVDELLRRFESICDRHHLEAVCREPDDNTPVRFPLSISWRPEVGHAPPSGLAAEVIEWVELFKSYLVNLGRHFVDWRERSHVLGRFPLRRYPFDRHCSGICSGEKTVSQDQRNWGYPRN